MKRIEWLREQPLVADSLLALAVAVVALGAAIGTTAQTGDPDVEFVRPSNTFQWLILIAPAVCLIGRRLYPVTALLAGAISTAIVLGIDLPNFFVAVAILFYSAVAYGGKLGLRLAIGISALLSGFTFLGWASGEAPFYAVLLVPMVCGMAVSLALHSITRIERVAEAEERAKLAELHRQSDAQLIVDQERNRIARELHDVVAHGLSMIAVQAGGAKRVLTNDPNAALEALGHIEEAARDSLTEMRQVLGVLRSDEDQKRKPTVGLSRLDELVENVRESGVPVEIAMEGDLSGLPATVDTGAYRIIQECLTNVMKHGGVTARAHVRLSRTAEEVELEVSDTGRGAASFALSDGTGHGLIGMKERAAVMGGTVRAGPQQGGGYRVVANLPLSAPTRVSTTRREAV